MMKQLKQVFVGTSGFTGAISKLTTVRNEVYSFLLEVKVEGVLELDNLISKLTIFVSPRNISAI